MLPLFDHVIRVGEELSSLPLLVSGSLTKEACLVNCVLQEPNVFEDRLIKELDTLLLRQHSDFIRVARFGSDQTLMEEDGPEYLAT